MESANGAGQKPSKPNAQASSSSSASRYHASSTKQAMEDESAYAAHNYHPLPVVFARARGSTAWDPEGRQYLDFLSAYSAVNQGHCHPELVKALTAQAQRLTLSSRAFHNDVFPRFAECVTRMFGYDMVLPMNTGAEAVETAVKIARKWGYKTKGIPEGEAIVLSASDNFHGRTVCRPITGPRPRQTYRADPGDPSSRPSLCRRIQIPAYGMARISPTWAVSVRRPARCSTMVRART